MWPYWVLFLIPAMAATFSTQSLNVRADGTRSVKFGVSWFLVMVAIGLMIGLRDRVGGDWFNYFRYLFQAETITFGEAFLLSDPGFRLLNVLSVKMGLGVVGVNLVCGLVFSLGLIIYSRSMPRPWLALAVAIPYMTIVVAMGYTRQGIALGFALIGFVALGRKRFLWYAFWVFLAASFHRSAVILIAIPLLTLNFRSYKNIPFLLTIAILMYVALLEGETDQLVEQYIVQKMHSDGAFIRLLMNLVPAIVFLFVRKRLSVSLQERKVYSVMSLIAVGSFIALIVGALPSTALDRMNLYIIPLQVFVFSNLPDVMGRYSGQRQTIVFIILFFYALVLFVWLNFANFSHWWQPYRMFPPLDLEEAYFMSR